MSLLVSLQLALYALMWALASYAHREERMATLHWLGYAAAATFSAMMLAWRPDGPVWLTHTGSSAATVLSLVLAGRGVLVFMHLPLHTRFTAIATAAGLACLIAIGPYDTARRVAAMSALNALVLVLALAQARVAFVAEFGARLALLAALPTIGLLGMNFFFLYHGLYRLPIDVVTANGVATGTWGVTLFGAAVFNFLFLFLVTFRLLRRLHQQASRDTLTGLPNRRAMEQRLALEWERTRRYPQRFVVIAIDVDHFKRINDQCGHETGDRVLAWVANTLQAHVRDTDHLSRVGGEEFLVILPEARADNDGALLAERLRVAVQALQLDVPNHPGMAVSASFGVSESQPGDTSSAQVLRRADQALYQAKSQGRNRVVLAPGNA